MRQRFLGQQPIEADVSLLRVLLGKCGLAQPGGWLPFATYEALPFNASTVSAYYSASLTRPCTVRTWHQAVYVATTNDGSNYWDLQLRELPGTSGLASLNTSAISPDTWSELSDTSVDLALTASYYAVYIRGVKVGSPGNLYLPAPAIFVT